MTSKRPQLTLIWDSKNQSLMSPQDLPPLLEKTRESVHSQLESIESKEDTDEFYKGKIIRVVLLRHYPYLNPNKKGGQTYDKLEDIDWERGEHLRKVFEGVFTRPESIHLYYDAEGWLERAKLTANDIIKKYPNILHVDTSIKLKGTTAEDRSNWSPIERSIRTFKELAEIRNNILKQELDGVETIVILGHTTYAGWFNRLTSNRVKDQALLEKQFEEKGYAYFDADSNLNPLSSKRRGLFSLPPEEMGDMWNVIFFDEPIGNRKVTCQGYQQLLTEFFTKKENLEFYFRKQNIPESLRVFWLKYLAKNQNHWFLKDFYLDKKLKRISLEEKRIILENAKEDTESKKLFYSLFILRPDFWSDSDSQLIKKILGTEIYSIAKNGASEYEKAVTYQRSRTLDPYISAGARNSIQKRKVFFYRRYRVTDSILDWSFWWDSKKRKEYFLSKAKESIDFNDFLHSPDHRKNILLQSVGAGKTFWLTELVKYATINGVPVKFFRADEISSEMLREDGEIYTIYQDQPETVFCFDSIDEIKSRFTSEQNEKEMIKQELIRWPWRCIITSRPSEYLNETTGFTTVFLEPLNTEEFLNVRVKDSMKRELITSVIVRNSLDSDIEWNPLLLTLLILLINEKDSLDFKELGIPSIEDIRTRADLYNHTALFALTKHARKVRNFEFDPLLDPPKWMKRLESYAFDIFSWNACIHPKDKLLFESYLSILQKELDNSQDYSFIHDSFYEYFLASYAINNPGSVPLSWNPNWFQAFHTRNHNWSYIATWLKMLNYTKFYWEILLSRLLNTKEDQHTISELEKFLKNMLGSSRWIEKLSWTSFSAFEKYLSDTFLIGIEILYKLPCEIRSWKRMQKILKKYLDNLEHRLCNINHFDFDINTLIKKCSKIIGHTDTDFSIKLISSLTDKLYRKRRDGRIAKIVELRTPYAIRTGLEIISQTESDSEAQAILQELAKIWTDRIILEILKFIERLKLKRLNLEDIERYRKESVRSLILIAKWLEETGGVSLEYLKANWLNEYSIEVITEIRERLDILMTEEDYYELLFMCKIILLSSNQSTQCTELAKEFLLRVPQYMLIYYNHIVRDWLASTLPAEMTIYFFERDANAANHNPELFNKFCEKYGITD